MIKRGYDFNVWGKQKGLEKIRHIHRNLVRRGLVEKTEDWRWSSFRAYALGEVGTVVVIDWSVLKMKVASSESRHPVRVGMTANRNPTSRTRQSSEWSKTKSPTSANNEMGHPEASFFNIFRVTRCFGIIPIT
jgi:hypothetical protein